MAVTSFNPAIAIAYAARMRSSKVQEKDSEGTEVAFSQWSRSVDGSSYTPVGNTVSLLRPGYYDTEVNDGQLFFHSIRVRNDDLIRFPDSVTGEILAGISEFWSPEREKLFRVYGMPYKRGVLMYGPPGSGKSCTLQLVARDVAERGGIVLNYNPSCFLPAYRAIRDIQPETQIVVLMEDFESLMKNNESRMLNLLDGVENLDRILFLATTNYPEMLEPRVVNRPSRFDMIVRVPHPNVEARVLYIKSLLVEGDEDIDAEKYAKDTSKMSLAHLKELFVATKILGCEYEASIKRLRDMCANRPTSFEGEESAFGGNFL